MDSSTSDSGLDYRAEYERPSVRLFHHIRGGVNRSVTFVGAARSVLNTFDELAASWSEAQFSLVADVVGAIAKAETAGAAWHPKATRPRYQQLARQAGDAARTAKAIADSISQAGPEIRVLVGQLADFVIAAAHETIAEHYIETVSARRFLKALRKDQTLTLSNILLADLVTVALGREPGARGKVDESTIRRRYGDRARGKPSKMPGSAEWNRNWKVITHVTSLPTEKASRSAETQAAFGAAIRTYLAAAP